MYVMQFTQHRQVLKEMTAHEFRAAMEIDRYAYRRVDAAFARKFVKSGGHHETGLWVDDGKVRYARAGN